MGLISPGGENLLDFLELRQVLSTYDGDLRDPLWWPQESPVPMHVARGPLGFPLPSRGRIPHLELGRVNRAPLDVGGTLVLPLKWSRVCRGTS